MIEFLDHFGALSKKEDPRVMEMIDRGVNAYPSGWGELTIFFFFFQEVAFISFYHTPPFCLRYEGNYECNNSCVIVDTL